MSTESVIGSTFVFKVLFVDQTNTPVAVLDPTISVFYVNTIGLKISYVIEAPMSPVAPAETGRFYYPFLIPTSFIDGDILYGEMKASDPLGSGLLARVEEAITLISANRGSAGRSGGLIASFIRPF
jgi:hypothetical protein